MFTVATDSRRATVRVRLSACVTVADLDSQAAALACEQHLDRLTGGGRVVIDAAEVCAVEPEAQGVLLFLLRRALEIPGVEVVAVAPTQRVDEVIGRPYVQKLIEGGRVRLFASVGEAERYVRSAPAA